MIETSISIEGPLAPQLVKRTVRHSFAKLRVCYEGALKRDSATTGLVVTEFLIGHDGRTLWADSHSPGTTITDQEMLSCLEHAFACFDFPEPNGPAPGTVSVRYSIGFEHEEGVTR